MSADEFIEISNRYEVREELGQGGMGVVYRAFDRNLDIDVAIKVLRNEPSDRDVVKFQKEAKASARLKHDSIIRVFDFGQTESSGRLYLVMEYISSENLAEYINENGPLKLEMALDVFSQILKGVRHAHEHQILHRDLKPSNILLGRSEDGKVIAKIVDFGVARILDDEDASSTMTTFIGSPHYVAPEMVDGSGVDQRSDIYSLGCVLFKVLTGRVPYSGDTIIETMEQHRTGSHGSLFDEVEEIAKYPEIETIADKCLKTDKDKRYSSVDELLSDIEFVRERLAKEKEERLRRERQKPDESGPAVKSQHSGMSIKKLAVPIVFFCLVFSGIVVWFWWQTFKENEEKIPNVVSNAPDLDKHSDQMEVVVNRFSPKFSRRTQYDRNWLFSFSPDLNDEDIKELKSESDVKYIWITDSSHLTGSGFKYLKGREVLSLNLMSTRIDDEGLAAISQLTSLKRLRIKFLNGVTDNGIKSILNLKELHTLQLSCKQVSDEGLDSILKLPKLTSLSLYNMPKITDKGFLKILAAKQLKYLNIGKTSITDKYFSRFSRLKNLKYLDITGLNLTDDSLKKLPELDLEVLVVSFNPDITDQGIMGLAKIKSLISIYVKGCPKVSSYIFHKYKMIRPHTQVLLDADTTESNYADSGNFVKEFKNLLDTEYLK